MTVLVLWLLQLVLAILFAGLGLMKLVQPYRRLTRSLRWPADFTPATVKVIGGAELLGAVGLILPVAVDRYEVLTPVAALALAVLMALAIRVHVRRRERNMITLPAILLGLNLLVAAGRFAEYL